MTEMTSFTRSARYIHLLHMKGTKGIKYNKPNCLLISKWKKRVHRENHWPATSHWQTLSHNVVSSLTSEQKNQININILMLIDKWMDKRQFSTISSPITLERQCKNHKKQNSSLLWPWWPNRMLDMNQMNHLSSFFFLRKPCIDDFYKVSVQSE